MRLSVVEGYLPIENIKLGCDDGSEIDAMKLLIRQMADLDIDCCVTISWRGQTGAGLDWTHRNAAVPK